MPKKLSNNTRLKKEVIKKLMTMSIQVDCLVYKNKMISVDIAKNNLQEINALKASNLHDARLLQVIEKLTRHMKNIISEAKPQNSTNTPIREATLVPRPLSPNRRTDQSLNQNIFSSLDRDATSPSILINSIQETLDLKETPTKEKKRKFTPPRKLNPAAIQKNIENNLNAIPSPIFRANTANEKRTNADSSQDIFEESQSVLQNCDRYSQSQKHDILIPTAHVSVDKCKQTRSQVLNNNSKGKQKGKRVNFKIDTNKKSDKKTQKKGNKKDHLNKKRNNKNSKPTKPNIEKSQTNTMQPERSIVSISAATQFRNEDTFYSQQFNHNSYNNTILEQQRRNMDYSCQNKITETDLSWVENIKYVRQVLPENYDPNLSNLLDSFWENCTVSGLVQNDFYIY